jgi:hypothetical protein
MKKRARTILYPSVVDGVAYVLAEAAGLSLNQAFASLLVAGVAFWLSVGREPDRMKAIVETTVWESLAMNQDLEA